MSEPIPQLQNRPLKITYRAPEDLGGSEMSMVVLPCPYGLPHWYRGHRYLVIPGEEDTISIRGYRMQLLSWEWSDE